MSRLRELQNVAVRLHGALLAQGHFYLAAGGVPQQIIFKQIYVDQDKPIGFLVVDQDHLPFGVQLESLSSPDTLRFLTATLNRPIKVINGGDGLIFCLKLRNN